jgi:hypothetical protein
MTLDQAEKAFGLIVRYGHARNASSDVARKFAG